MGNGGWYGTDQEWARIETPLKDLDPGLNSFARKYDLDITKNFKDWPERSLTWGAGVHCLIQIFLADQSALTWNFWICASQDRGEYRYWKQEMPRKAVPAEALARDLFELLEAGKRKLDHWSAHPEELELAVKLGHP